MNKRKTLKELHEQYKSPEVVFQALNIEARQKLEKLQILLGRAKFDPIDPWGDSAAFDGLCEKLDHLIDFYSIGVEDETRSDK